MMSQIRDLQNKENSLSDAREFYDPELGSSSGATHVPLPFPSPRTLPRCDSGLPRDTLNGKGVTGNVFWTMTCSRRTTLCNLPHLKDFGIFSSGIGNCWMHVFNHTTSQVEVVCPIILVELILTVVWWIIGEFSLWNGILENSLTLWNFKAGKSTSELGFVYDQPILRSLCSGSKKLRLPHQLTILWHRDRLEGSLIFLISICFMRWLRQPWRSISARSQTSE